MSSTVRKNYALESLLTAVVHGSENFARKIVTSRPELLLDSSAIARDLSGREIKGLTPLQAAICAGDVNMVQMIKEVLRHKLQDNKKLSFDPGLEIQSQFTAIYPNGDISSLTNPQKLKAKNNSNLLEIFHAINRATVEQVNFELNKPGILNADSQLNAALHSFREQFTATLNQELIFNPFYLVISLHLYNEKNGRFVGNSDSSWLRRNLFLRQVVGYIQRHFPACYLQALVQGFYYFARYKDCKLRRDYLKLSGQHACKGVGYQYAIGHKGKAVYDGRCLMDGGASMGDSLATYYEQKNQVWRTYLPATDNDPLVACRLGA